MESDLPNVPPRSAFVTTRWTRIVLAQGEGDESRQALADLCEAYYPPVAHFISRQVFDPEKARDLTQEFFRRILETQGLQRAREERGRFRSYLLGAVKNFLRNEYHKERQVRRGGQVEFVTIQGGAETEFELPVADTATLEPDKEFDRKWAMTLLARALSRMELEMKQEGKELQFETLKPWLTGDQEETTQTAAGRKLDLSATAVKVAVHRLRKRFRDVVKVEVRETLHDPSQLQEELQHLLLSVGNA